MPMFDYHCINEECGIRFEAFSHPGHNPVTSECPSCQCHSPRELDPQVTMRRPASNALRFDPVIIDRRMEAGEYVYSYPGSKADPLEPGYERIQLSNISEVDRHVRSVGGKEQELRSMNLQLERQAWDRRTKERREDTRALIARKGFSGKYFDAVCQLVDRNREKRYRELENKQVAFHNQALSFDASNRQGHSSAETGWRDRK